GSACVVNRRSSNPLQCFGVSNDTEIIEMAIFVCKKKIDYQHLIQRVLCFRDTEFGTASQIMLIAGMMVLLLQRLYDVPCRYKFRVRRDKIFTDAVRIIVL